MCCCQHGEGCSRQFTCSNVAENVTSVRFVFPVKPRNEEGREQCIMACVLTETWIWGSVLE